MFAETAQLAQLEQTPSLSLPLSCSDSFSFLLVLTPFVSELSLAGQSPDTQAE